MWVCLRENCVIDDATGAEKVCLFEHHHFCVPFFYEFIFIGLRCFMHFAYESSWRVFLLKFDQILRESNLNVFFQHYPFLSNAYINCLHIVKLPCILFHIFKRMELYLDSCFLTLSHSMVLYVISLQTQFEYYLLNYSCWWYCWFFIKCLKRLIEMYAPYCLLYKKGSLLVPLFKRSLLYTCRQLFFWCL